MGEDHFRAWHQAAMDIKAEHMNTLYQRALHDNLRNEQDWNRLLCEWYNLADGFEREDCEAFERAWPRSQWPAGVPYGNLVLRGRWERQM
jgi:hypothetical protein